MPRCPANATSLIGPIRTAARRLLAAMLAVMIASADIRADEGMWTFDNLPVRQLKERYGFVPTPDWIAGVRSAAVRFNSGGSGAFVSPDGLVMTNHHVAADTLQKISTPAKDYYKEGFLARTRDDEVKAPDLELNVLVDIRDVTDRVNAAVSAGMDDASAAKARRQATATIEKESFERTGLRSDVVTLYRGGRYHLYTYKKYTDVRLVFAPEYAIAFFGGDPDNFEFPRYDLDVAFFRAYEDGKPAKPGHYLPWGEGGTKEGDLVFVAGNPGSTSRLNTTAHLDLSPRRVAAAVAGGPRESRGYTEGVRPPRGRGGPAVEAGALRRAEQPEVAARPARRPAGPRTDRTQGDAGGRAPSPDRGRPAQGRGVRSGLGQDRRLRSTSPGEPRGPTDVPRVRGRLRLPVCSRSPGRSSGSSRRTPSPTPSGSASTAMPAAPRSSGRSTRRPRSTPSYEEAKLARSLEFWRRDDGRVGPDRRPRPRRPHARGRGPRAGARFPSWPTSRSARSWSRAAARPSRHRTTR